MAQTYFRNFNTLNYGIANTPAIDLTERIVVQKSSQSNPNIFYPLDISDGTRADMIAHSAWGDPYASWVIYVTNKIIDPYYDFYLTQEQFVNFINTKYGSITAAQQMINYFQTDWLDSPTIDINAYNALDANQKKYYGPNYMNTPFIQNYSRNKQELIVTTNYILNLTISGNTIPFSKVEPLQISYVPGSNGTAQFITGNATNIIVQHGQFDAFPFPSNPNTSVVVSNTSFVTGVHSGANAFITGCAFVSNNIALDEVIFWSPVTAYDAEVTKNAGNRIINVLQQKYLPAFVNKTANLLSQVVR